MSARPPAAAAIALSALLLGAAGCASTDNGCVRPAGLTQATVAEAAAGRLEEGAQVRWGGVLVETRNLRDSTELEVAGYPLDACGRPRTGQPPAGRFVIVHPGYLEAAELRPGRAVTATGRFTGVRSGRVGEALQRLPLLSSYKPTLWPSEPAPAYGYGGRVWPSVSIGIGGGSGGVGGGVGIGF